MFQNFVADNIINLPKARPFSTSITCSGGTGYGGQILHVDTGETSDSIRSVSLTKGQFTHNGGCIGLVPTACKPNQQYVLSYHIVSHFEAAVIAPFVAISTGAAFNTGDFFLLRANETITTLPLNQGRSNGCQSEGKLLVSFTAEQLAGNPYIFVGFTTLEDNTGKLVALHARLHLHEETCLQPMK